MANIFLRPTQITAAALGLLEREIVLPGLVWTNAAPEFAGKGGETVSIRVPARTTARTRPLRGTRQYTGNNAANAGAGIITMDELEETLIDVSLDEAIYNAIPITDEELTLDITDFGQQVLAPQVRAVAEGLENKLAAEMVGATYATTIEVPFGTDPYLGLVDARVALNKANVPMSDRVCVVGADFEAAFLKSEHFSHADQAGDASALRDARIGRVAGFGEIYLSNALPADEAYAFHRTAFVLGMRASEVPSGVSYGASTAYQGLALRMIRDYDFRNVMDRSLVDVFAGTNIVADGPVVSGNPTFVRAVKLTLGEEVIDDGEG